MEISASRIASTINRVVKASNDTRYIVFTDFIDRNIPFFTRICVFYRPSKLRYNSYAKFHWLISYFGINVSRVPQRRFYPVVLVKSWLFLLIVWEHYYTTALPHKISHTTSDGTRKWRLENIFAVSVSAKSVILTKCANRLYKLSQPITIMRFN